MIGVVNRAIDNFLGRGEAAVTVPPLDGAFSPNRLLDDAKTRFAFEDIDCLTVVNGVVQASAGDTVFTIAADGTREVRFTAETEIVCIAALGENGLAVALAGGDIVIAGGPHDGRRVRAGGDVTCVTALVASGDALYVANGSATNTTALWQRDLLERNATGSVWRIGLDDGRTERIADGLAWPAGLALAGSSLVVSEAWKHRLMRIFLSGDSSPEELCHDLPGYPGRISRAPEGWWLAVFAPRSQLVEFILREPAYRKRMLKEVAQEYWVAPKLRTGRSFYEPLQGGGVKHLGLLKPWAPTMSAGLCVHLGDAFQPASSMQSRADGATHGVTSVVETGGDVIVAAKGDGVLVTVPNAIARSAQ